MTTPARKAALKFFNDLGEVDTCITHRYGPSEAMLKLMRNDKQIQFSERPGTAWLFISLTDAGRTALHEAGE